MKFEIYIETEESYPRWWKHFEIECDNLDEAINKSEELVKENNQHLVEREIYQIGD